MANIRVNIYSKSGAPSARQRTAFSVGFRCWADSGPILYASWGVVYLTFKRVE